MLTNPWKSVTYPPTSSGWTALAIWLLCCATLPAETSTVIPLDQGKEPRRVIAYSLDGGTSQSYRVQRDKISALDIQGLPVEDPQFKSRQTLHSPSISTLETAKVEAHPGDARIVYEQQIVDFEVTPAQGPEQFLMPDGTNEPTDGRTREVLGSIRNHPRKITIDTRGNVLKEEPPLSLKDLMARGMDSEAFLRCGDVILPEQPVGEGARWLVIRHVVNDGIAIDINAVFELKKVHPSGVCDLEVAFDGSAPKQLADYEQTPPGQVNTVERFTVSGSGKIEFDPKRPQPLASDITMKSQVALSMTFQGETRTMEHESTMTRKIESMHPDSTEIPDKDGES